MLKNIPDPQSIEQLRHVLMPGAENNTSWLLAMETIKINYGKEFGLRINYKKYRFRQMVNVYKRYFVEHSLSEQDFEDFRSYMRAGEKLLIGCVLEVLMRAIAWTPQLPRTWIVMSWRKITGYYMLQGSIEQRNSFRNILDVFEAIDAEKA